MMGKLFTLREGIGKKEGTIPRRFTEETLLTDNRKSVVRID